MQLFSEQCYAAIDFNEGTTKMVAPMDQLRKREIDFDALSADQKQFVRDTLFENYLPIKEVKVEPKNAIQEELQDFVDCIHNSGTPRVSGKDGSDAVAVAEQVLLEIENHRWNGDAHGPRGPLAIPGRHILSTPHWSSGVPSTQKRRAG